MTKHILLFIQPSFQKVKETGAQTTLYVVFLNNWQIKCFFKCCYKISYTTIVYLIISGIQRLYELVVRHFLACCSQPAVGAETTVEIDIAGEQFNASGRVILAVSILFCCFPLIGHQYYQYFKQTYSFSFSGATCPRICWKITSTIIRYICRVQVG